jgi:hypothetical protein
MTVQREERMEESGRSVATTEPLAPLFSEEESGDFRRRWESIQAGFVEEPRRAVDQAEHLVGEVMTRLNEAFAGQRGVLDRQRDQDKDVSTEDLRQGFRRYHAFFDRLLSV